MQNDDMVLASDFCLHHSIGLSFIHSLREYGLIETVVVGENIFLPSSDLDRLEKFVRLHFDLDINMEGIETITHLLQRMEAMQQQIARLSNRLKAYED